MQRRWQPARRTQVTTHSILGKEMQHRFALQQAVDAGPAAESKKVRAAAEDDVLTMIEPLARVGVEEGAGAAAELPPRLKEFDRDAPFGERRRRGQARHAAADDRDAPTCPL